MHRRLWLPIAVIFTLILASTGYLYSPVTVEAKTAADAADLLRLVQRLEANEKTLRRELLEVRADLARVRAERDRLAAPPPAPEPEIAVRNPDGGSPDPGKSSGPVVTTDLSIRMQVNRPEVQVGANLFALDASPRLENNIVFLPVRNLAELLGFTVDWEGDSQTVIIRPRASK